MSNPKTFRTALNGFHREDVVHYIEYLSAKHRSECAQMNSELEYLRSRLAEAPEAPAVDPALAERCADLEAQLLQVREEKAQAETARNAALAIQAQLENQLQQALEANALAEAAREEALAAQAQLEETVKYNQSHVEQELEAYRRAERTERLAQERAQKVYHRVNSVLGDATVKVDDAAARIGGLSDQVMAQLNQLQEAVISSKQALQEASEVMYTIRPTTDEE